MLDFETALTFFILINPIGNSPLILAMLKDYPLERQKAIMMREGVIALVIALFFQLIGKPFLSFLGIEIYSLSISGGVILLLTAFKMIFTTKEDSSSIELKKEPIIVPIATPILTGPGLMTMIMISAGKASSSIQITLALLIAFAGVLFILYAAPYLQKVIGKRGMTALQQIMGLVLALLATDLFLNGLRIFIKQL